jgi:hypothetical protein
MSRPYFYGPEEYMDLGQLGEHAVEFHAFIVDNGERYEPHVMIAKAEAIVKTGEKNQAVNILPFIQACRFRQQHWERQIAEDWRKVREREWDIEVG